MTHWNGKENIMEEDDERMFRGGMAAAILLALLAGATLLDKQSGNEPTGGQHFTQAL